MAQTYKQLQRDLVELESTMTDAQLDAVETSHIRKSTLEADTPEITITRSKLRTRLGVQWLYSVMVPGEPRPFVGTGVGWARTTAKKYNPNNWPIIEGWK